MKSDLYEQRANSLQRLTRRTAHHEVTKNTKDYEAFWNLRIFVFFVVFFFVIGRTSVSTIQPSELNRAGPVRRVRRVRDLDDGGAASFSDLNSSMISLGRCRLPVGSSADLRLAMTPARRRRLLLSTQLVRVEIFLPTI
jgi:hypothetical protein